MNAFPRLSAWLGLAPAPSAEAAAEAPPTGTPMEVEEEATAAAAAAWLSPELATSPTAAAPAASAVVAHQVGARVAAETQRSAVELRVATLERPTGLTADCPGDGTEGGPAHRRHHRLRRRSPRRYQYRRRRQG